MLYPETLVKAVKRKYASNRVSKRVSKQWKEPYNAGLGLIFLKGKKWVGATKLVNETVVMQLFYNFILVGEMKHMRAKGLAGPRGDNYNEWVAQES